MIDEIFELDEDGYWFEEYGYIAFQYLWVAYAYSFGYEHDDSIEDIEIDFEVEEEY
jgi:hypothetical protein